MKTRQIVPTWATADGRVIPITELGDAHLVNILTMAESNMRGIPHGCGKLPEGHLQQYPLLVKEALGRGLFTWSAERNYLGHFITTARSS